MIMKRANSEQWSTHKWNNILHRVGYLCIHSECQHLLPIFQGKTIEAAENAIAKKIDLGDAAIRR